MNKNKAAASYHTRISSPKYGQKSNVKPLTANRSLLFAVKWLNLDLKFSSSFLPLLRHSPHSWPYHLSLSNAFP